MKKQTKETKNGEEMVIKAPEKETKTFNRFFNKEINWLEFNQRVLQEAFNEQNLLLERLKFLAIFYSNLDEFFMIRVSGLLEKLEAGLIEPAEDGFTPKEQLAIIRKRVLEQMQLATDLFKDRLLPALHQAGVHICEYEKLNSDQKEKLNRYFEQDVFPVLTPLAFDPGHPFPHISNQSLNLAVVLRIPDLNDEEHFARVKIPNILPRLVPVDWADVPGEGAEDTRAPRPKAFVWLEQLVAANLEMLFPGVQVIKSYPFRVIRDADLEIREDLTIDLLQTIQESLHRRRFGSVVFLSVEQSMPQNIRTLLMANLDVEAQDVYPAEGPPGLADLMQLYDLDLPRLKDSPLRSRVPALLQNSTNIFQVLKQQDILLHHPYDSFSTVVEFIQAAAADPQVLAIKQTIYRVGNNSPIVEALAQAATNGKQVSVLVEIKARFDEESNIEWARALEKAGAHVVFGKLELKTHCKIVLVVRKEPDGIRRYVHLGTGNYNYKTARLYTDLCLLTSRKDIAADVTTLFNTLTGYSLQANYQKILVSPGGIRQGLLEKIEREIAHAREGRPARLIFKMNALVDFDCIEALYRASQAGVQVDLIIRGMCSLVPGVPGLSENIRVISVVGRFLEHSRIYYFQNGEEGREEVYLGSADLMQRNLDRRIETLFPLEDTAIKAYVTDTLLPAYFKDNVKAHMLLPEGRYKPLLDPANPTAFSAQDYFQELSTEQRLQNLL